MIRLQDDLNEDNLLSATGEKDFGLDGMSRFPYLRADVAEKVCRHFRIT